MTLNDLQIRYVAEETIKLLNRKLSALPFRVIVSSEDMDSVVNFARAKLDLLAQSEEE